MERGGSVYIMTNKLRTTLYTGVTSNLVGRIQEHRNHEYKGSFTDRYHLEILVYHESFSTIQEAISREKELKKWRREKKNELIKSVNPYWKDLWDDVKNW